jgi:hypothetical protein
MQREAATAVDAALGNRDSLFALTPKRWPTTMTV